MSSNLLSLQKWLTKPTLFGVKVWILILTFVLLILLIIFILITICRISYRKRKWNRRINDRESAISGKLSSQTEMNLKNGSSDQIPRDARESTQSNIVTDLEYTEILVDDGRTRRPSFFALEEIESATDGFSKQNIVNSEDYCVDYSGILADATKVTVKRFTSNRSLGDEEFIGEAERIWHISHKNLVRLIGYCTNGTHHIRMLVYENVENGNLHQWLHECTQQPFNPLTWPIRMNIIQGIAKGLAYLHEDVEPQILHGSLKCSNILLDRQWNPKIVGFGLVNLFPPDYWPGPLILRRLGYESTYDHIEKNDVYNFGVLVMEMITGRTPLECNQPQPYLVEWVKSMIGKEQVSEIVDSRLEERPSSKELKRMLLIALRCVDRDIEHRPKMAHILHMLQPHDLLLSDGQGHPIRRGNSHSFSEINLTL